MIPQALYEQALYDAIRRGATELPPMSRTLFTKPSPGNETPPHAKGWSTPCEAPNCPKSGAIPCARTPAGPYFFRDGNQCQLEGGMSPGENIGENIPDFTYRFVPGSDVTLTYVAKGGGSECFGGTRHRVIAFADGLTGIKKFVVNSCTAASRAGAVCPLSVVGVGIGGTANVAASLTKQAAALRTVGSRHPEPEFARLEDQLYEALNSLGVGIMEIGGGTSVLAVHVEARKKCVMQTRRTGGFY